MGLINRHGEHPHVDGEELTGGNLEVDILNIFNELSGGTDNANLSALAGLSGTKFLDGSVPGSKLLLANVLEAKIKASAVSGAKADGTVSTAKIATGITSIAMGTDVCPVTVPNVSIIDPSLWSSLNSVSIAIASDTIACLLFQLRFVRFNQSSIPASLWTQIVKNKPANFTRINTNQDGSIPSPLLSQSSPTDECKNANIDFKADRVFFSHHLDLFTASAGDDGPGQTVTYNLLAAQETSNLHTVEESVLIVVDLRR